MSITKIFKLKLMRNSVPFIVVAALWLIVLPARLCVLIMMPIGSSDEHHKLNKIFEFFVFD